MSRKRRSQKRYTIRRDDQRKAVASPLRMELLGLFVDREALAVSQIAERMGRPASAIHYHVGILAEAGLLERAGERPVGRRKEALYRPVADLYLMEHKRGAVDSARAAIKTLASAFRMAERDMQAALNNPEARSSGPYRNVLGARMHCRMSKQDLKELNGHLRAIETMLARIHRTHEPSSNDEFVSLTVALAPLRDREVKS